MPVATVLQIKESTNRAPHVICLIMASFFWCCANRHVHPCFEMCAHYMPERRNRLGVEGSEIAMGNGCAT